MTQGGAEYSVEILPSALTDLRSPSGGGGTCANRVFVGDLH